MVTQEREVDTHGRPLRKEFGITVIEEAAHVRAVESLSGEAHVKGHGHGALHLLHRRDIVSGPGGRIALTAQEVGTGQDKRSLVRIRGQNSGTGSTDHVVAEDIVVAYVVTGGAAVTTPVDIVVGHGHFFATAKNGRLIDIVPDAVHAQSHEVFVQTSPPLANFRHGEVRPVRESRPHITFERLPIGIVHEIVIREALLVHPVGGIHLGARVNHIDRLEVPGMEIVVQALRVRETIRVEGEDPVTVHVVDIHPDDITGNIPVPEFIGHLLYAGVGIVGETALLIAESPQGRHLHGAGKASEGFKNLGGAVLLDHDYAEGGAVAGVGNDGIALELRAPGIVEDNAEGRTILPEAEHPGMGLV